MLGPYLYDIFSHSLNQALDFHVHIPQLYQVEKLSLNQIASKLGISRVLVRTILREAGVPLVPARGRLDLTGQTPFGWKRELRKLVPHVAEQRIISRFADSRRDGMSLHSIARALNLESVPTKNGGKWHARSVSQILECNSRLMAEYKVLFPGEVFRFS